MKCPFLKGNYLASCKADREVYVPTTFELREYCKTSQYLICPFYFRAKNEGKQVRHMSLVS